MAMNTPQIAPVTTLQRDYSAVLRMTAKGPVFLAQRSKPVAAVLSMNDYESLEEDAKQWRRQALADKRSQEIANNPNFTISFEEVERDFIDA